jgi:hypothetical protein
MMIFKKAIPRRRLLRGLGATLALPLLDGMIPAFAAPADTAVKSPTRLGICYVGNGMWPMDRWTPKTEGAGFELTPTLKALAPYRDQLLVLSGLAQKEALPAPGEGPQDHSRATATYLTGIHPKPTGGKDYRAGITMDQIAAKELGKDTQMASLEVSLCPTDVTGLCEVSWTCVYLSTLAWRTPTTPLPMESSPRALFERLFGDNDSTDRAVRLARIQEQRSILDWVIEDVSGLAKELGGSDRVKLTEYLDTIRDVERRIQIAENQSNRELPTLDRPNDIPVSYEDYAKLMIDLQVLAFKTDLTRVITFMMTREGGAGDRPYTEIGISDVHHPLSHHQNNSAAIDKLFQINLYHMKMFAYFLEKLRSTPDGDGNLLDHTIMTYGAGLENANIHQHTNLPLLLAGGGGGKIKGGRHVRYPDGTPMTNLHLTLLDKLGIPMEKFGDSTGKLDLLSV